MNWWITGMRCFFPLVAWRMLVTDMPRHQSSHRGRMKRTDTEPKMGKRPRMIRASVTVHSAKARMTPWRACQSMSASSRFRM
ncbi:MAG TPA: hypothetical protein DHV93_12140 [Holophagaceae bacterium]|nr:hypothetical protein [Holophagaceae bacterium]